MQEVILDQQIVEEESSIFDKAIVSPKNYDWIENEVMAIVFRTKNFKFDLCGKSMLDWVKLACVKMPTVVIDEPSDENLLETIKLNAQDKKIVLVLYSNTPLLQQATIVDILDYFSTKDMNALILPKGFVFKTEYLNQTSQIFSPARKNFAPEEFKEIVSASDIARVCEVFYNRIREFHKQNGVILKGEKTIFIDADVQIESGVVIEPFNVIKGNSVIEANVVLKSGNYIDSSIIKSGVVLLGKNIVGGEEV